MLDLIHSFSIAAYEGMSPKFVLPLFPLSSSFFALPSSPFLTPPSRYPVPLSTLTKTLTAILFPLTAFLSSPVMGACLAYDALGVALGQRVYDLGGTGWTTLMFVTAATTAAAVAAKVGMNWYV